jgi:N-acetylmuramic acid 6-phosphate etherase
VPECVELFIREDAAVLAAMEAGKAALSRFIAELVPRFTYAGASPAGRLIYLGAGTSGRLGVLDASEAPPTFCISPDRIIGIIAGGDGALRKSSEGAEDDPQGARAALEGLAGGPLTAADTVVAIAAGGTTPYAVGALAIAKELSARSGVIDLGQGVVKSCLTALLCCTPCVTPSACDHHIVLPTGPEVLTGSTRMKAGTATKLALNMISTTLMIQSGRVYQNLMVDVRPSNAKLVDRAARIIGHVTGLARRESLELLERAKGCSGVHSPVKVAVMMHRLGLSPEGASKKLDETQGRLP